MDRVEQTECFSTRLRTDGKCGRCSSRVLSVCRNSQLFAGNDRDKARCEYRQATYECRHALRASCEASFPESATHSNTNRQQHLPLSARTHSRNATIVAVKCSTPLTREVHKCGTELEGEIWPPDKVLHE